MFISVTRLRLRSILFLPLFAYEAGRSRKQAEASRGCLGARVRKSQGLAFWTFTFWQDERRMREFRAQSPHSKVMPKLANWCDEVVCLLQPEDFRAVGNYYDDFSQVEDEECLKILRDAGPEDLRPART